MPDPVAIEKITPAVDSRGLVVEPLGPDDLPNQRNVHLVLTEPGAIRGNHYHERGTEVTVVIGPALFRYKVGAAVHDFDVPAGQAYRGDDPAGGAACVSQYGGNADRR